MKYPKTYHLHDLDISKFTNKTIVIEEKMDGTQVGIKFDNKDSLILFSRNNNLLYVEDRQFDLLKQWAHQLKATLWDLLGTTYIMYAEWMYACHSIYYDLLPNYFLEYDIYNSKQQSWLNTIQRHKMLKDSTIQSVKVIQSKTVLNQNIIQDCNQLITSSNFKSENWRENLCNYQLSLVEQSDLMEGLYLKFEDHNHTIGRSKFVRKDFINFVMNSKHWKSRQMIINKINNLEKYDRNTI